MLCKICGHETRELVDRQFDHLYHRCDYCEVVFQDEKHLLSSSEEQDQYDRHENSIENEGYVKMFETFTDEAVMPFVTGEKALDFGSGPSPVYSRLLERRGFLVSIFDAYYQNDPKVFAETYDLITSTEVFEHLYEPLSVIEKLVACLKEEGILAVMTRFFPKEEEDFQNWWYRRDPTHVIFYTKRTFEVLASMFGLEAVYSNDVNYVTLKKPRQLQSRRNSV